MGSDTVREPISRFLRIKQTHSYRAHSGSTEEQQATLPILLTVRARPVFR